MSDTRNPHRLEKIEPYNPMDFIDLSQGVFLGLNSNLQPHYIPLRDLQSQHMEILGNSGAGKGAISNVIFTQLIQANEGVFFFDSKGCELDARLLESACKKIGKPFYLLNFHAIPDKQAIGDIFDKGGCCYVLGSMRNAEIIVKQKAILTSIFQLAEGREAATSSRPIAISLDESKYYISTSTLESIAQSRDRGIHMLFAHFSIADLNNDSDYNVITENTSLKLFYCQTAPWDTDWIQSQSESLHAVMLSDLPIFSSYFLDNKATPELLYGSPFISK